MSSLFNQRVVQIALVFLAFYVIMQIVNQNKIQENLDTLVTVDQPSSQVTVQQSPLSSTQVTVEKNPPDTLIKLQTPTVSPPSALATSSTSAKPVATDTPSAALTAGKVPSALTSVDNTLVAAAPTGIDSSVTVPGESIFAPEPSDFDALFEKKTVLDPSDLIPKNADVELYGGFKPDPNLDQNFLQNRWSLGIDTSVTKHNFINDLRGAYPNPITNTGIFNLPTQLPDLHRKSLGDIS